MTRIEPLSSPYEDVAARLEAMMPSGVSPIGLFCTFVRNLRTLRALTAACGAEKASRA